MSVSLAWDGSIEPYPSKFAHQVGFDLCQLQVDFLKIPCTGPRGYYINGAYSISSTKFVKTERQTHIATLFLVPSPIPSNLPLQRFSASASSPQDPSSPRTRPGSRGYIVLVGASSGRITEVMSLIVRFVQFRMQHPLFPG